MTGTVAQAAGAEPGSAGAAPSPEAAPAGAQAPAAQAGEGLAPQQDQTAAAQGAPQTSAGEPAEGEGLDAGNGQDDPAKDASVGAPEGEYSTEGIELPEGIELDAEAMKSLGGVCKDLNLSQKAFSEIVGKMTPVLQQRQAEQLADLKGRFIEACKADPEMGGSRWAETRRVASSAYQRFAGKDVMAAFRATGLDHHPGVIRMFKKISDSISDDAVVRGQRASGPIDPLDAYYDNTK